jgi:hypothetical protein
MKLFGVQLPYQEQQVGRVLLGESPWFVHLVETPE